MEQSKHARRSLCGRRDMSMVSGENDTKWKSCLLITKLLLNNKYLRDLRLARPLQMPNSVL